MRILLWIGMFYVFATSVYAKEVEACKEQSSLKTPLGELVELRCDASGGSPEKWRTKWMLNTKEILSGYGTISYQFSNSKNSLIVLQDFQNHSTGCPDRLFLVDLTGTSPREFSFGIKNACNVYHWAKWSDKKRSVIALKYNVQFTYLKGKLIPPEDTDGDKFGTPLGYAAPTPSTPIVPFVQELTPQIRPSGKN
jgi:hypothetical protein